MCVKLFLKTYLKMASKKTAFESSFNKLTVRTVCQVLEIYCEISNSFF